MTHNTTTPTWENANARICFTKSNDFFFCLENFRRMTFHVWKRKINTFFPLSLVPNPRHLWPFFHPPPSPSHSRPPCLGRLEIKSWATAKCQVVPIGSEAPPSAKTFHKWAKLVVGQSAGCSLLMHVLLSCWTWMMAMWHYHPQVGVSPQCRAITLSK